MSYTPHVREHITGYVKRFYSFYVVMTGQGGRAFPKSRIFNRLNLKINLQNAYVGDVLGCHRLLPVIANCYQKMTSQDRL